MELTFPAPLPPDQKVDEIKRGITILLSKENLDFVRFLSFDSIIGTQMGLAVEIVV